VESASSAVPGGAVGCLSEAGEMTVEEGVLVPIQLAGALAACNCEIKKYLVGRKAHHSQCLEALLHDVLIDLRRQLRLKAC